jgi:catechol 2,3-dioxygenase-like lactoylglutathione lyase family enzyme
MPFLFDHVARVVPDIAEAVRFVTDLIPESKVLYQDTSWAFVDAAGTKLAFVLRDQHPDHLAWRVGADELEQLAAKHGKEIRSHRDGTRSFYVEGPAGIAVEIITFDGSRWENPS